jgi:hypothetical protein
MVRVIADVMRDCQPLRDLEPADGDQLPDIGLELDHRRPIAASALRAMTRPTYRARAAAR